MIFFIAFWIWRNSHRFVWSRHRIKHCLHPSTERMVLLWQLQHQNSRAYKIEYSMPYYEIEMDYHKCKLDEMAIIYTILYVMNQGESSYYLCIEENFFWISYGQSLTQLCFSLSMFRPFLIIEISIFLLSLYWTDDLPTTKVSIV